MFDNENEKILQIPDTVKVLSTQMLQGKQYLEKVIISKSVEEIEFSEFSLRSELAEIEVHPENQYFSSIDGVLYDKSQTKLLRCPRNVQSLTIPETVKEIRKGAFYRCGELQKIILPPKLQRIEDVTFGECVSLEECKFPETLRFIGQEAFAWCPLKDLVIREEWKVEYNAFTVSEPVTIIVDGIPVKFAMDMEGDEMTGRFFDAMETYRRIIRERDFSANIPVKRMQVMALSLLEYDDPKARQFLENHADEIFLSLIDEGDIEKIQLLLEKTNCIHADNIDTMFDYAITQQKHEIMVLLMEYKNNRIGYSDPEKHFRL